MLRVTSGLLLSLPHTPEEKGEKKAQATFQIVEKWINKGYFLCPPEKALVISGLLKKIKTKPPSSY